MGKITDRREKTAHTNIENKAVLADGTKPKSDFPYKKILIIVLALVAVVACVLLVVNAFVDSYADKFATGKSHTEATVTVDEIKGDLYENTDKYLENVDFSKAYAAASANHANNYANLKSDPNVFNFIITINSENSDADSANLSTIMMMSINKGGKEVKTTYYAFNKAMLVQIPGVGVGPLYDAYGFGKAALLTKTVQDNFGVKIDGYVDMSLKAFVDATIDLGGIVIDDSSITDDERNLDTEAEIYNYVALAEDRNAAMTTIIKALAAKSADAGIFGIKGVVDTVADSLDSYITRDNFGDLISIGADMFKGDVTVTQIGYKTATGVTKSYHGGAWAEPYEGFATVNYETEVKLLQSLVFPTVEEAK